MPRVTKIQLQAEVEALRHNAALLEAQIETLRAELAAAEAKLAKAEPAPAARTVTRVKPVTSTRRVFTFDPTVPGDYVRAAKLARENGGFVQRAR